MQNYKQLLQKLCIDKGITLTDLLGKYNEQHGSTLTLQSFSRTLSQGTIKAAMLDDVLNVLGYELTVEKVKEKP